MRVTTILFCIFLFSGVVAICQEVSLYSDSINNPEFIRKNITYKRTYPFINYNINYLEWNHTNALNPFFEKLRNSSKRKVKILQIGDSHLQFDLYTGYAREQMQHMFGMGGRGLVFPFTAARTHSAYDYRAYHDGIWEYTRNVLRDMSFDMGVCGATIHTKDTSAGFKFQFLYGNLRSDFNSIKIFCKTGKKSFDLKIKTSGLDSFFYVSCKDSTKNYVDVTLPKVGEGVEFYVNKTDSIQDFFECYGIQMQTPTDCGVLYNSAGINGAGFSSVLRETKFDQDIKELQPDLVIIDLGANDFTPYYIDTMSLGNDLKIIINKIKTNWPEACILVSNTQDMYRRKKNWISCPFFSELTRNVAMSNQCAFYDYFRVSGGNKSMLKWYSNGLAQRDKVHLTFRGYETKGELFYNAILNSYSYYLSKQNPDSLILGEQIVADSVITAIVKPDKNSLAYADPNQKTTVQYKSSNTGNTQVKTSNTGQLKVAATTNKHTNKYVNYKGTVYYTVQSGDTLWDIANRYKVSVEQIKRLNNLYGSRLDVGMVLLIK